MVIDKNKTSIAVALIIMSLLISSIVAAATITVTADRNPVGLNESFTLTFESDSSVDSEPDFSPLNKGFQILSRNSNSSMSIVNGKISSSKKWKLTALARRAGKLIIPSVRFGKDTSKASFLTVSSSRRPSSKSSGVQDIFIEVEVEPQNAYVQSEVIYTVRLFLSVATSNASLSEPGISGANAVIERLGEDSNFQTNRSSRRFNVVERRYAIYPQVSGSMTIEPVMFQGQTGRNAFSLFNDPYGSQPRTVIERSEPITLEVKAVPDTFPGGHWIPAKELRLTEAWSQDPPEFQVGEPLTRTLTLVALGQTASQLEGLPEWVPEAFKQYPDQPVLSDDKNDSGITATRVEKVAIIPNSAGEYVLPEIRVPWWNTDTNKLEYARIAERKIVVKGITENNRAGMVDAPRLDDLSVSLEDNGTIIADPRSVGGNGEPALGLNFWQLLSAGLALAWIFTCILWWRARAPRDTQVAQNNKILRLKEAIGSVEKASLEGDVNKLKQALLDWAQLAWPDDRPTSLGEIARRSPTELKVELEGLNNSLYSQQKAVFDGTAFWQTFKNNIAFNSKQKNKPIGELEPLYRL